MEFIGREEELELINKAILSTKQENILIYGRRRIGKTELIKQAILDKDIDNIYYESKLTTEMNNVESVSLLISELFNLPRLSFKNIEELLDYLFNYSLNKELIFIIDEYPYLKSCVNGLDSIIQSLIDKYKHISKLKLILCGSYVDIMKSLTNKDKPLYGRFTRIIDLKPMNYLDSSKFYKSFSNEDKIALYSVFGGVPYYNSLINENLSVKDNIIELIASNNALLINEIPMYLRSEISKINNANEVFETLALGNSKFTDILNSSHIPTSPILSDVLDKLCRMEVIIKEAPINDINNKKKTKYYINDNLTLFYYKYIYRNSSKLNVMNKYSFYDTFIDKDFNNTYIPKAFENICKQFLIIQNKNNKLDEQFFEIGKYYYDDPINNTNGEFDVVTLDNKGYIFYECKYKNKKLSKADIDNEIAQVNKTKINCYKYGFFSKSGFDKDIINIIKYTIKDLF